MPKGWTTFALLVGAVLLMTPAVAQESGSNDLDPADRALVHGYDPAAMQLLWATWLRGSDQIDDSCEVEDGETYTYQVTEEGVVIESGDGPVSTESCDLTATDVRGPEGQVNHGTVVSSFVHALKEQGIEGGLGCYVSAIARTDYGKRDQQLRTSDPVPDPATESDGQVQLTVTDVDCDKPRAQQDGSDTAPRGDRSNHGEGDSDQRRSDNARGRGKDSSGKPEWAGQPGPPPHANGGRR